MNVDINDRWLFSSYISYFTKKTIFFNINKIEKLYKIFFNIVRNFYYFSFKVIFLDNIFFKFELKNLNLLNFRNNYITSENWFFKNKTDTYLLDSYAHEYLRYKSAVFVYSMSSNKFGFFFKNKDTFLISFINLFERNSFISFFLPVNVTNFSAIFSLINIFYFLNQSALSKQIYLLR